jgi:hypothetical protein
VGIIARALPRKLQISSKEEERREVAAKEFAKTSDKL